MQSVKEKVQEILDNANLTENIDKEAELWNILYNISSDLQIKGTDSYDTKNEELVGYINAYEYMYFNNFPKKRSKVNVGRKTSKKAKVVFLSAGGVISSLLLVKLLSKKKGKM